MKTGPIITEINVDCNVKNQIKQKSEAICLNDGSSLHLYPYFGYASSNGAPQRFWGSGENGFLFSGSGGALVIILGELGSKLIILGI